MNPVQLAPILTPHGHLSLAREADAVALDEEVARRLEESFARSAGHGLLQLGAGEVGTALPAVFSYWREFAARYVTALCTHPSIQPEEDSAEPVAPPPDVDVTRHAKIGELSLERDFLESALSKAGLLSAKRWLIPRTNCLFRSSPGCSK
jgi:hypothetical protein